MSFAAMLQQAETSSQIEIAESWGQGRATFGGLVAALLYQHLRQLVGKQPPIRSLSFSFVAPAVAGVASLEGSILRKGKSAVQAEGRMVQNGQVVAVVLASFGAARESSIIVPAMTAPVIKSPEQGTALPYIPGMTPEFTRHFNLHWSEGALPFHAVDSGDMAGWMRFAHEQDPCSPAHLLALVDAWPPSVLQMFKTVAPISSLTWTIEFIKDTLAWQNNDWWQYEATTDSSGDGYAHIQAKIWDQTGQLVALSRQVVAVFA